MDNPMQELAQLSEFIVETKFQDLPDEVIEHANWVFRDSVGVIIAGMAEPEVNALAAYAADNHPGKASLFGYDGKTSPEWAALVHGTAGTSLEMDEGHAYARGHASIHAVPPALAMAEAHEVGGEEALTAMVIGYEVAARAGIATKLRKGVHPFGAWGVLGAAAVGAKFNHSDPIAAAGILEIAASFAITPSFNTAYQGANIRNTYAGIINRLGLLAADLHPLGFRGEVGGLQTTFGSILGDSFDPTALTDGLGERYEIMRGYFKPYSACRYAHAAVDALLGITAENELNLDDIASIEVATYDIAATLKEKSPSTPLAGRFSIPHTIAATLTLGTAGPEAFTPDKLENSKIQSLAQVVEVIEDPEFTRMTPDKRPARIRINMKDGAVLENTVYGSKGDPDQPMSAAELNTKFRDIAAPTLGKDNTEQAWKLLGHVEQLSDISSLTNYLGM